MSTTELFNKHFGNVAAVDMKHQNMESFFEELNAECLQEDKQKNCIIPHVTNSKNLPHCWGKMKWILKYEDGKEPDFAVCRCEHGSSECLKLTRENANR